MTDFNLEKLKPDARVSENLAGGSELRATFQQAGWCFPSTIETVRGVMESMMAEAPVSQDAQDLKVGDGERKVPVRIIAADRPQGVYFYCHGGGFSVGWPSWYDGILSRVSREAGVTVVSVDYHLAPEFPFPAPLDDCEVAARWLLRYAKEEFGTDRIIFGGDSAGANLALATLLRLRDTGLDGVVGANLVYGTYDLTMTPSQRAATADTHLVPNAGLSFYYDQYVPDPARRDDPEVSPLYADLSSLPPIYLTVGSCDSLVDDNIFLAARLLTSGVPVELNIVPGADHGFDLLPLPDSEAAVAGYIAFIEARVGDGGAKGDRADHDANYSAESR